jgi:hypothetical protein
MVIDEPLNGLGIREMDIMSFQEDMGFSSEEDYKKWLAGTEDEPDTKQAKPKEKAEESEKPEPRYVLLLHSELDVQILRIFKFQVSAERAMAAYLKDHPEHENFIMIRTGLS